MSEIPMVRRGRALVRPPSTALAEGIVTHIVTHLDQDAGAVTA